MDHNTKIHISKYLITTAALLPIAKHTEAKNYNPEDLHSVGEYTLGFSAGLEHLLPSGIINSQIKGKDLEGFNPGVFLEIGVFKWSGQHGNSNYEYHMGFTGRFDYHNFHSRAYNINDVRNVNIATGEPFKYIDPNDHGCAQVQDFINTLNMYSGLGWGGATLDANAGIGWHFDNHGNFGPVVALGMGFGYRFNKNIKLKANWRLNMFPFENLGSKSMPATTPGLRNNLEISVLYKLNALHKGQEIKKHTRGKQR